MSQVLSIGVAEFDQEVLHTSVTVLVDFYSTVCPPCRTLAPHLDQMAAEFGGCVKILKVSVDEEPELATRYGITAVPTLVWFHEGRVVERTLGADPTALRRKLRRLCLAA